jgi:hypothetical protein
MASFRCSYLGYRSSWNLYMARFEELNDGPFNWYIGAWVLNFFFLIFKWIVRKKIGTCLKTRRCTQIFPKRPPKNTPNNPKFGNLFLDSETQCYQKSSWKSDKKCNQIFKNSHAFHENAHKKAWGAFGYLPELFSFDIQEDCWKIRVSRDKSKSKIK